MYLLTCRFFFQAEDGIRDLVRSRGLGDVYKRQELCFETFGREANHGGGSDAAPARPGSEMVFRVGSVSYTHLTLPTSDLV